MNIYALTMLLTNAIKFTVYKTYTVYHQEEQARRDEEYLRIIEDEKRRARLELASIGGPINERAPESISEAMSQPVGESGSGSESEDASPGVSDQDQTHVAGVDSGNDPYAGDTSATQGQFGNNFEHLDDYISHR